MTQMIKKSMNVQMIITVFHLLVRQWYTQKTLVFTKSQFVPPACFHSVPYITVSWPPSWLHLFVARFRPGLGYRALHLIVSIIIHLLHHGHQAVLRLTVIIYLRSEMKWWKVIIINPCQCTFASGCPGGRSYRPPWVWNPENIFYWAG